MESLHTEHQNALKLSNELLEGVFPLAGRDHSFAVVAVRCNSNFSTGKKKLEKGRIYYLLNGYPTSLGKFFKRLPI